MRKKLVYVLWELTGQVSHYTIRGLLWKIPSPRSSNRLQLNEWKERAVRATATEKLNRQVEHKIAVTKREKNFLSTFLPLQSDFLAYSNAHRCAEKHFFALTPWEICNLPFTGLNVLSQRFENLAGKTPQSQSLFQRVSCCGKLQTVTFLCVMVSQHSLSDFVCLGFFIVCSHIFQIRL